MVEVGGEALWRRRTRQPDGHGVLADPGSAWPLGVVADHVAIVPTDPQGRVGGMAHRGAVVTGRAGCAKSEVMPSHPVRYTTVDGLQIAYQVVGDGPIDIVLVDEWATPLEDRWQVPAIAGRLDRLAASARLISFDKRSIGLSDSGPRDEMATPELWVRDLVAVMDAAGAERPVILGAHEGGPIALLHAASVPDRTEALVLVNTGARLLRDGDAYPWGYEASAWRPDLEGIVGLWQSGSGGEDHIGATAHDPWWRSWYAQSRRRQATPSTGLALMKMIGQLDVRSVVPSVRAPSLVLHRTGNRWWPVEGARWLADNLAQGRLVELDGADNYWWSGDADQVVDEIERFLLGDRASEPSERELVTVMFTDLVDSTATASTLGDTAWRTVLDAHDRTTHDLVERHGGIVVKNLGDGYLLHFGGPAAAIRAARDFQATVDRSGLRARVAIHTGEAERRGADLSGIAIHLAARVMAQAEPGEILVTDVVRGLVAGSPTRFRHRGRHRFKGIPDTWDLYAVEPIDEPDEEGRGPGPVPVSPVGPGTPVVG